MPSETKMTLGIDIGGTNTKFALLNSAGKTVFTETISTNAGKNPKQLLSRIAEKCKELERRAGGKIGCAGLAVAGDIDPVKGIVRFSPNIACWRNIKIARELKKFTGTDFIIGNDADMSAWGIYAGELKKKHKNILAVSLGTGIGAGLIIDGKLYRGHNCGAGELGHLNISRGQGPLCGCGKRGCLEAYFGKNAILRRVKEGGKKLSLEELYKAAKNGDKFSISIWQDAGKDLAVGLAGACLLLNPEVLALTGGLCAAADLFMPSVKSVFAEEPFRTHFSGLKIKIINSGYTASVGAGLFAFQHK